MFNWIFFTGAPGSRWSGISQVFRDTWEDADNSDLLDPKKLFISVLVFSNNIS